MLLDKKDIIIAVLCIMLFGCMFIIAGQHEQINTLKDEIHTNREFISTELHLIDSMYDNNYRLWDWRVEQLLKYYENQGYLIRK